MLLWHPTVVIIHLHKTNLSIRFCCLTNYTEHTTAVWVSHDSGAMNVKMSQSDKSLCILRSKSFSLWPCSLCFPVLEWSFIPKSLFPLFVHNYSKSGSAESNMFLNLVLFAENTEALENVFHSNHGALPLRWFVKLYEVVLKIKQLPCTR